MDLSAAADLAATEEETMKEFENLIAAFKAAMGDVTNEQTEERDGFTYFFEQEGFDPVTHEALFHVHFQRNGESKRRRVFTYDWRIWTVPELRDALLEAGFASVRTYLGELLHLTDHHEDKSRWTAFVVGLS